MSTPAEVAAPVAKPANFFSRTASVIHSRPWLVLPVWIVAYIAVLWHPAHRPLWYDELFTYYVSMSPTFQHFVGCIRNVDLNPPLGYLFVRSSIALFGDTPFAARIPAMLAFLVASLIVSHLIYRRLGGGFGLAALGIFWSFSTIASAVEVRSYGLIIAFFSIAALCWLNAVHVPRWSIWHTGLLLGIAAMFLTHCFSPSYGAAIGAGELVRTYVARRIDKRIWLAILAPLIILPFYIPLVDNAQRILTPYAFEATALTIPRFYLFILLPLLPGIGAILFGWLVFNGKGPRVRWQDFAAPHEIAFGVAAFFAPLITISYCIYSGVPFWPRHGGGAIVGGALILTALLAVVTKRNSNAAVAAAGLILVLFCVIKSGTGKLTAQYDNASVDYRTVRSDLPFVAASGLAFLEMDHREGPEFVNRLHYLTDRETAERYHTTIFEGIRVLKKWFPVRANIDFYHDFINNHRQFLVLGTPDFPEDWLLVKLKTDGAQIRLIQDQKTGYRDHQLYEVTVKSD